MFFHKLTLAASILFLANISYALEDGRCDENTPCADGACCSWWGWCGESEAHCGATCLSNCTSGTGAILPAGATRSVDGTCNATTICPPGNCCSTFGFCGNSDAHCISACASQCTITNGSGGGSGEEATTTEVSEETNDEDDGVSVTDAENETGTSDDVSDYMPDNGYVGNDMSDDDNDGDNMSDENDDDNMSDDDGENMSVENDGDNMSDVNDGDNMSDTDQVVNNDASDDDMVDSYTRDDARDDLLSGTN